MRPQTRPPSTLEGRHHYLLFNRESSQVVQRGLTGASGIAFDRLILAPSTRYRIWVLKSDTLLTGFIEITSPPNGGTMPLPDIQVGTDLSPDPDADGLGNDAEFIMGTNPDNPDTDGDGLGDGAEVRQGSDPLSGRSVRTGVIGSAILPSTAVDVCALNDLALVACRDRGISVLNIFSGMSPVLIAQLDTPGDAVSVTCAGNFVAVADGASGLAVVDITDPPNARIVSQINVGGEARAVTAVGTIAYVGLTSGQVVAVELVSGAEQQRLVLGTPVHDLVTAGSHLFVLAGDKLHAFRLSAGLLESAGELTLSRINPDPITGRKRLFVGGGIALAANANGYDSIDVSKPDAMRLVGATRSGGAASFKQIVANGSGMGVALVGAQPRDDGTHDVSLYRTTIPANTADFLTTLPTPGLARAVSIYNGIAYVADGSQGLQVVNYLAFDDKRQPPAIRLTTSAAENRAEEGQLLVLGAEVTDDVQVRNVEFYLDGQKAATDGNYPFEQGILLPLRTTGRESVRVRARASDTGGNATWSEELIIALVPDGTPPRLLRAQPGPGSISGSVDGVLAFLSEPINRATLVEIGFRLTGAGPDGVLGTDDDSDVSGGTLSYRESLNAAVLQFPALLPPGNYRAVLSRPIADLAGNPISVPIGWGFRVFDKVDDDRDGVPDELEPLLGLDPTRADTDGDNIRDGDEDTDRDGLPNAVEIILGTDPKNPRSVVAGILDGNLDRDNDGLTDGREILLGTNPFAADSDGDGWNDESEVSGGGDPLDRAIRPRMVLVAGGAAIRLVLPRFSITGSNAGVTVAGPSLKIGLPVLAEGVPLGVTLATPLVRVVLTGVSQSFGGGVVVGSPHLVVVLPSLSGTNIGLTVAQPPLRVKFQ